VLTFLDPVCWTDCPLLAHQLRDLSARLTPNQRRHITFVAVAANPLHESIADVRHFIDKYQLDSMANLEFVTGPLPSVQSVWRSYGVTVNVAARGVMSIHSDVIDIVDTNGNVRVVVPDDPLGSAAGADSTVVALLAALHQASFS